MGRVQSFCSSGSRYTSMVNVVTSFICIGLIHYGLAYNQNCPSNLPKTEYLREYFKYCYEFVFDNKGTWHDAEKDCISKGGFLTDIHSFPENNFILNSLQVLKFANDNGVWIGLNDEFQEGTWSWVNLSSKNFTNWAPGQPGVVAGSEDCALLEVADLGHWHDYPCDGYFFGRQSHGWVCKYLISGVV